MIDANTIQILIDDVDYTTSISDFSESGGEKSYKIIKVMNGTFKRVLQGKSDYQLEITFKVDDETLHNLFDTELPITIEWKDGTNMSIQYNNMLPYSIKYITEINNIITATISYSSPSVDENNADNRQVL